jgi:alpha-L-fucosidase 2
MYVGKCTDLERLGSSIERAFMTTCGVIKCLEVCAAAAKILGVDAEYATECVETARRLREGLPVSEGRFIPYPDCKERSIGVFSGKFPYNVINKEDPRLLNAWSDFLLHEDEYGNMYAEGHAVNAWYASWKTEGFARIGDAESAYESLVQAARAAGAFSEFYEVNERELVRRPWFMTAAAVYTSSLNDMLVSSDGETVTLLPGYPKDKAEDLSFRLAAKGGVTVEAKFKKGLPTEVRLSGEGKDRVRVLFDGKEISSKR